MKRSVTKTKEPAIDGHTYKIKLPIRKAGSERKKIRQLLRSMLPMEDHQRELQEERKLFERKRKAH